MVSSTSEPIVKPGSAPADHNQDQPAAPRRKGVLRLFAESVLLVALAIAALEIFFTITGIGEQESRVPDKVLGWRYPANHTVCYRREGFSHETTNSVGMRDSEHTIAKPAGVFRIALMGDSATAAMQVAMEKTTAKRLEAALNEEGQKRHLDRRFEVLNFGSSGYSLAQQACCYNERVRQYSPDVVALLYTAGDAGESVLPITKREMAPVRPYFYLDKKGALQKDRSLLSFYDDKLTVNPFWNFLECNSHIYGVLCQTDLELSNKEYAYKRMRDSFTTKVDKAFSKPRRVAPDAMPEPYLVANAKDVGAALLKQLNQDVKRDHGKFVIYCFPNSFDNPEFFEDVKQFSKVALKEAIPFIDLDPIVRHSADPKAMLIQIHFSELGHKLATEKLLKMLEPICFPQ